MRLASTRALDWKCFRGRHWGIVAIAARCAGLLVLIVCIGCSHSGIPLDGSVSVGGVPVTEGAIAFEAADGRGRSVGAAIQQGRYHVPRSAGLTPGKKNAHITATYKTGQRIAVGMPAPPGTMVDEVKSLTPPLQPCEVPPEATTINFDLAE